MTQVYQDQTWAAQALCADIDPDALFVRGSAQVDARQMCFSCPVRIQCLADALDSGMTFGVWGGMTERERRALVRRFPEVRDWWLYLNESDDIVAVELRAGRIPRLSRRPAGR
ncbi:WhiB family transcriptional regulator [Trueperella sp. LYQ143]|uniref:WhiB family transcriptional regulator n=1 Tax=unclassified Trueperella TaxID=2630174 RepID=UPI00398325D3